MLPPTFLPRVALVIAIASLILSASRATADDEGVLVDPQAATLPGVDPTVVADGESKQPGHPGLTPLLAPIPFKNSQLGWGLVLMAGAIHRFDADTTLKPSTGAIGGFYTENKSWGLTAFEMARLGGDRWRLRGALTHLDVRYDFFGIGEDAGDAGVSVPLGQTVDAVVGTASRRIVPGL